MSSLKTLYTFNVLHWAYDHINVWFCPRYSVTAASDSCYAAGNGCQYRESHLLSNDESPVLILNPAPASASCDNSSFASSKPCFSDIYMTPYDQTFSSTLTSSSSLLSCEAECEYCEEKEGKKGKMENDIPMSPDSFSCITVLASIENSASDTVEDEHEQRNTAPCTDTLDIDIPMSVEEPAADAQSFTPQSPSSSPPPLCISPMQIQSGRMSNTSPRPPPPLETTEMNVVVTKAAAKSKEELESMNEKYAANRLGFPQSFLFSPFDPRKNSGFISSIIHYIFYTYLFAPFIFIFTFVFIFHLFFLY